MRTSNSAQFDQRRACLARGLRGLAGLGGLGVGALGLAGCATRAPVLPATHDLSAGIAPFSAATAGALPAGWQPYVMRPDRATTQYTVVNDGPRSVLHAKAVASASGLRCAVDVDPARQGVLRFSWRVQDVPSQATVIERESDDSAARVVLAFAGDEARLSIRERLLFEQVELFTGLRLPFATLMYVWDGKQPPGTVTHNHRTSRIRYLTVESGVARSGRWLHYERDVVADYRRAFGEAPGHIHSVGVLTDSDAMKLDLEAWYGDITLLPA